MQKLNDLNRSPTPLKPDGTLIAVIEMSLSSWLVAGIVPGVERLTIEEARGRREPPRSEKQRGMIAARLATMKQGDNQHSPNGETSQAKAAEVSKRRVERSHEMIAKGVPDQTCRARPGLV